MAFIVDASITAGWLLPDEKTEIADALALRMHWLSPSRAAEGAVRLGDCQISRKSPCALG